MNKNRLVKQTRCALLLYIVAIFVAMPLYAGGTYAIKDIATFYNFCTNFLSDLGRTTSHSGDLNFFSSFLFNNAMVIFGIFYGRFIYHMTNYLNDIDQNIASLAKIASIIACFSTIGVALTPADVDSLYLAHILFANNIFYFGCFGTALFGYLFLKSNAIDNKYGWILLFYSFATIGYICVMWYGPKPFFVLADGSISPSAHGLMVQASAQKIIFLIGFFSNWMTVKAIGSLGDR